MNKPLLFKYTTLILLVFIVVLSGCEATELQLNNNKDTVVLNTNKKKYLGQTGYIIDITTTGKGGDILIASGIKKADLKKPKKELFKYVMKIPKHNLTYYGVNDETALNQLKYGQKVTVYDTGVVAFSDPGQTGATKIIVHN